MYLDSRLWVVIGALAIAAACSSSSDDGGESRGPAGSVGVPMSELGDLGSEFIEENQATYDTIEEASDLIGAAFAGGIPAASAALKQAGCLPAELAGQTLLVDVQSETFTPTVPRGPAEAVQIVLLSDPQTEVGYANITCQGVFPSSISVNVTVNLNDGTEVLNLTASNIFVSPPATFQAMLSGTLSSSSGNTVDFGAVGFEGGSALFTDEFSTSASTAFLIDAITVADVNQNVFIDPSFASEDISILLEQGRDFDFNFNCESAVDYEARMFGTPGNVSGGGIFCARPPIGDDFRYHVNCTEGSIDDLVVSRATLECQENAGFFGDATQLPDSVLQEIQDGTDALIGMHRAVIGVARAGAAVALQLAASQQGF